VIFKPSWIGLGTLAARREGSTDVWTQVLGAAALIVMGIGAGILFAVALALVPGFATLSPAGYVRTHQLFDPHFEPTMPTLMVTATALNVLLVFLSVGTGRRVLYVVAAVLLFGVMGISRFAAIPLLRMVRGVDPDRLPADWRDPRPAWRAWHLARTALAVLALASAAAASVWT
jgi:Anthrone oxygenase